MRIVLIAIAALGFVANAHAAETKPLSFDPVIREAGTQDNAPTAFEERAYREEGIVDLATRDRVALSLPGDWKIVGQGVSSYPIPSSRVRTDTVFFEHSLDERTAFMVGARRTKSRQQGLPFTEPSLYGIVGFATKF
jgi:hypothetical protein